MSVNVFKPIPVIKESILTLKANANIPKKLIEKFTSSFFIKSCNISKAIISKIEDSNILWLKGIKHKTALPINIPNRGIIKCIIPTIIAIRIIFLDLIFSVPILKDKENVSILKAIPIVNNIIIEYIKNPPK